MQDRASPLSSTLSENIHSETEMEWFWSLQLISALTCAIPEAESSTKKIQYWLSFPLPCDDILPGGLQPAKATCSTERH